MAATIELIVFIWSVGTTICRAASSCDGCVPTGQMTGPGGEGPCPFPMSNETCPITPTYQQLKYLWPCPAATNTTYYGSCTPGNGGNPLCTSFTPTSPQLGCCCPSNGCYTPPYFNWIIGACKGSGCGGYDAATQTKAYKDAGTQLLINYVATYQWNSASQSWVMLRDSSFNTDGALPPFDAALPNGGLNQSSAWLKPQPGGAASWKWGYYPAGVRGAGPPGMMFVLSVEKVWNMAWYMLNQVTLDKGPAISYPSAQCMYGSDNCWASGNAGEIDFLESPWTVNAGAIDSYRRLYAVQWNQVGRSFIGEKGSTCHADGGWFSDAEATNNYFLGTMPNATNPYVFVAVVDRVGTFIYRIPAAQINEIWPGLSHTTAACSLVSRPTQRPSNNGPPCDDSNPYCALFLPNCQAAAWGGASAGNQGGANQGCTVNAQQGWCENWWNLMDNTGQWLWPANGRQSVVQFQAPASAVSMPWNYEMESWLVNWTGNAIINDAACCVANQGKCITVSPSSVVQPSTTSVIALPTCLAVSATASPQPTSTSSASPPMSPGGLIVPLMFAVILCVR